MGKRLVALSLIATLVAWPAWSQDQGSVILEQETAPPPSQAPVDDAPGPEAPETGSPASEPLASAPVDDAPVDDAPVSEDPVAEDPAAEVPPEEAPVIDPILPIGNEPVVVAEPAAGTDPDNSIGACRPERLYIRGDFGKAIFTVDVARTPEDRAQGLMDVDSMPISKGMLFVYPAPQPVAFWMKNTLIPLDMIFADSRGVVVNVHSNATPGDLTSIPGGDDIQFVLEINGGLARMMGIKEGAQLRHPAIRRGAWPC